MRIYAKSLLKLIVFYLVIMSLFSCSYRTYTLRDNNHQIQKNEYIVIIHGLRVNSLYMHPLARFLSRKGYNIINIDYPSTSYSLETTIDYINKEIKKNIKHKNYKISIVGYSLGGLVARAYIAKYHPENLNRLVLIGVPNKGSEIADYYAENRFYNWFFGPVFKQLLTKQDSIAHLFSPLDIDVGVIASDSSRYFIFRHLFNNKKNDGFVSLSSATLNPNKDVFITDTSHITMPFNKDIMHQTYYFIEHGVFEKAVINS